MPLPIGRVDEVLLDTDDGLFKRVDGWIGAPRVAVTLRDADALMDVRRGLVNRKEDRVGLLRAIECITLVQVGKMFGRTRETSGRAAFSATRT